MSAYERLSLTVSLVLLGLTFFLVIELPTRTFAFSILGSPLSIRLSETWLMAALLVGLACFGSDAAIRAHPLAYRERHPFVFWILPGLSVLLAALVLPVAPDKFYWLGGLVLTALFLSLVIVAEYHTVDPMALHYGTARLVLDISVYAIALALFTIIYSSKARSLISATTTLAISSLLTLELLRGTRYELRRIGWYALASGVVMGEAVWALNYGKMDGLHGGLLLLLIFYLITGLARQGLLGKLNRRTLIEFGLVALIGLGLLGGYAP